MNAKTCSFEPCGRKVKARGLCQSHYNQERAGEELRPIPERVRAVPRAEREALALRGLKRCTGECKQTRPLNEFGKDSKSLDGLKGFCSFCSKARLAAQYAKHCDKRRAEWREYYYSVKQTCVLDGCDRRAITKSEGAMCPMHYRRKMQTGDIGPVEALIGLGDDAGYDAVHKRLTKLHGKASEHNCVDCGRQAQHWSYDHSCPNERVHISRQGYVLPFSIDLDRYKPRDAECHTKFDKQRAKVSA